MHADSSRPGSGKSTLAYPLSDHVNELLLGRPPSHPAIADPDPLNAIAGRNDAAVNGHGNGHDKDVAICVGQDGWHYSRAELDTFDDPQDAHWRRVSHQARWPTHSHQGAAFTFNLASYTCFLHSVRLDKWAIPFPTFDHAIKDPAPSPLAIEPHHRIIIVEGLYTMYDAPGWRECAEMMDLRVWFDVPREVVAARVLRRNVAAGIVSEAGARERVEEVDMANGDEVASKQYRPTTVVHPSSWDTA